MKNKKSQETMGFRTLIVIAAILVIGVILIIILRRTGDFGYEVWVKIKNILPFV